MDFLKYFLFNKNFNYTKRSYYNLRQSSWHLTNLKMVKKK
jgi:hypothetical protein